MICGCAARAVLAVASDLNDGVLCGVCTCEAILLTASGTTVGSGGGNGEMEMLETEAECAW
jgi:hypothetical protein